MTQGDGLDHYVQTPPYTFIIRIVQGALAVILLGLVAYPTHVLSEYTDAPDALAFNLFTAVWTFLVIGYAIAVPLKAPKYWNKWAALALEFITWIFWLTAFAIMADFVRKNDACKNFDCTPSSWGFGLRKRQSLDNLDFGSLVDTAMDAFGGSKGGSSSLGGMYGNKKKVTPWWAICAVCTALGAIGWVLWSFTLYTYAVALKNHSDGGNGSAEGGEKYGKQGDVELNQQSIGGQQHV